MVSRKTIPLTAALIATLWTTNLAASAWQEVKVERPRRRRALGQALSNRDLPRVAALLRAGANPNEGVPPPPDLEPFGDTPLSIAILRRDRASVRLLLQAGANPKYRLGTYPTVMLAVGTGDEQIVRRMLEAGASPNARDCWSTVMEVAVAKRDWRIVRLLREFGARK